MEISDEKRTALQQSLEELVQILRSHGERQWSGWFAGAAERLRAGDPGALDRIKDAYGGMGSFNDLGFATDDGHPFEWEELEQIHQLGHRIRLLANGQRHDATECPSCRPQTRP